MPKKAQFEDGIKKTRIALFIASTLFISAAIKKDGIEGLINATTGIETETKDSIYDENDLILTEEEKEEIKERLEEEIGIPSSSTQTEDNYLLLNAVYENTHLNEQEKRIFYDLVNLIEECDYKDREYTYHTLQTIDSSYYLEKDSTNQNIVAKYYDFKNEIKYLDLDPSYYVVTHEDIHALFRSCKILNTFPDFLKEGMTELLNREYAGSDPFSPFTSDFHDYTSIVYQPEICSVKLLCELIGENKMLEAYSTDDIDIIYDALANIYKDKKEAKKLINGIEDSIKRFKQTNCLNFEKKDEELFSLLEIYVQHASFYNNNDYDSVLSKTSCHYNMNLLKCMYGNEIWTEKSENFIKENGIIEKAYFCEDLKNVARNEMVPYQDRLIYMYGRAYEKRIIKTK